MRFLAVFLGALAVSSVANAQDIIHTTDGIFYCHGSHPRCSWPDQSTYPYYQFGGQHVGQMSGVSDLLPDGPALLQYQTWLTELISLRPNTNAVASWSDAFSKVDQGRVWGSFISARSELPAGADSQLIGLEIDVLNGGLPGVYPNQSKVGLQIVGFGAANTNAIEIVTQTPSAAFQNIINIQPNSIAPTGAVIGMTPQNIARGIDFQGSTFSDGAFLLSPNQKIVFRIPGLNDASIYRDQFSNGYLVLQAGTPGLRITNAQDTANLLIVTNDGDLITPRGSFSNVLSRLSALESKTGASAQAPIPVVPEPAAPAVQTASTGFASANSSNAQAPVASGVGSLAAGANAAASGESAIALGADSIAAGNQATALGNRAEASTAQSVAIGSGAQGTAEGATAIGAGAQATGSNSVAIGANSTDGGQANVVSVGSATQTRRLTNVAAGLNNSDGVNVGQLNQAVTNAQAYTDARIAEISSDLTSVRQDIQTVRRDAEGATASAMALAGVPQTFERGRGMIGVGVGTWQGESAVAFGISKATDDGKFVLKAGATYNSRSQGGANAGVGWAF